MSEHGIAENLSMSELLVGEADARRTLALLGNEATCRGVATEVGVTLRTEPIERATHVEFLLRVHVEEGKIDRLTTGVATFFDDVFLFEEDPLV